MVDSQTCHAGFNNRLDELLLKTLDLEELSGQYDIVFNAGNITDRIADLYGADCSDVTDKLLFLETNLNDIWKTLEAFNSEVLLSGVPLNSDYATATYSTLISAVEDFTNALCDSSDVTYSFAEDSARLGIINLMSRDLLPMRQINNAEIYYRCGITPVAGLHYPKGKGIDCNTEMEEKAGKCLPGQENSVDFISKEIQQANRKVTSLQFNTCFLNELTDISRTRGKELEIRFNKDGNKVIFGWGSDGATSKVNITKNFSPFHTHPRATQDSSSETTQSQKDIWWALFFAAINNVGIVTTVGGKICGGPLELSVLGFMKGTIYVTNDAEKKWVERVIAAGPPLKMVDPLKWARLKRELNVEVNPKKIAKMSRKLPPKVLEEALKHFRN